MAGKTDPSDKVVLALIGAGGRGTNVILNMRKNVPGVEVKYVCEVDESRGGRAIDELSKNQGFMPKRVNDMRFVFDDRDVDAVVICTPEHWHALATVRACEAGKDVMVEKNISHSIEEGRKMIEAAEKYGRVVQCGTQNRSAEYAFSAREYIQSGKLGNIVHVRSYCMLPGGKPWFLKPDTAVPEGLDWNQWLGPALKVPYNVSRHKAWYDWWAYSGGQAFAGDAIHVMDLARLVLGDPGHPESVYATGGRVLFDDERDVPDILSVTYDYGQFTMSCTSSKFGEYLTKTPPAIRHGDSFPDWDQNATRIEIYGTDGMMYLGRMGGGWQVLGNDGEILAQEYGKFPDTEHQDDFIDAVRTGRTPNGNIREGHKSAVLVHLGNLSHRIGNKQIYFDTEKESIRNSPEALKLDTLVYRTGFEF